MEKKLAIVVVAIAFLPALGCTKPATTTPTTTASNSDTESGVIQDREVIQTAATEQEPAGASKPSGEIGAKAPAWENLSGTDDKQHSLMDLAEAEAVAVVFTCNTCPVAVAYEDRIKQLADDYKEKGVELVAINVNNDEPNQLPAMKERAEEKGFTFAYLYDPSQQIARDYGATVTPHAFLLNKERKVVYAGAIDDSQDPSNVKESFLRSAIDATLAGEQPAVTDVKPVGCGIKYE